MTDHAKLSPSAAHRWLTCTAAPSMESTYPDEQSIYAHEGTVAHEVAEGFVRRYLDVISGVDLKETLLDLENDGSYSGEMENYAQDYASYILELTENLIDPFVETEVRLDLTKWIPDGFGTADCVIISEDVLYIIDYKYGKGVKVEAENNPQMKIYALGALERYKELYEINQIKMVIYQPRLEHIAEFGLTASELTMWANEVVIPKAKEAYEGKGIFAPSEEACRFCKARAECRARTEKVIHSFDDYEDTEKLSAAELADLLSQVKEMKEWIKDIEDRCYSLLKSGEKLPGWKLVAGRSNRKYINDDSVVTVLKEHGYKEKDFIEKKLLSISKLEKVIGKKEVSEILQGLIIKPEGNPTLAPSDDPRPEVLPETEVLEAFDK